MALVGDIVGQRDPSTRESEPHAAPMALVLRGLAVGTPDRSDGSCYATGGLGPLGIALKSEHHAVPMAFASGNCVGLGQKLLLVETTGRSDGFCQMRPGVYVSRLNKSEPHAVPMVLVTGSRASYRPARRGRSEPHAVPMALVTRLTPNLPTCPARSRNLTPFRWLLLAVSGRVPTHLPACWSGRNLKPFRWLLL